MALLEFIDIHFLWRVQMYVAFAGWAVFSISFIQTQTLPLPRVSSAKSHPLIHSKSWISKEPANCPIWRSCLIFHDWLQEGCPLNGYFFLFLSLVLQALTKTNAILFSFYFQLGFLNAGAQKMGKEGQKANTQACCVPLYRLCTLQGVHQRRGVWLESRAHLTCPDVCPALGPCPLRGGVDTRAHLSWPLVPPTLFLSPFFSLSCCLFILAENLYEVYCNWYFSLTKQKKKICFLPVVVIHLQEIRPRSW